MEPQRIRVVSDITCEVNEEQQQKLQIRLVPGYINRAGKARSMMVTTSTGLNIMTA